MADKQAQAMERLTAKLTALRKTLRGEERKILDQLVLNAQSEVTAHSKSMRPSAGPSAKPSARPSARLNLNSDVELHSANVRRVQTESKTASASARKSAGPEASKTAEAEGRQFMRITLSDGNYRVTIL